MDEKKTVIPSVEELEVALKREQYRRTFVKVLRNTLFSLVVVAAAAVIIAMLILPVMRISGSSMSDTLEDGDIVISLNNKKYKTGDVIGFYYNNSILIKRVIATSGDWVDIDLDGNVYVNGVLLQEPYVQDKAYGDCNIALPYQVPEGRCFVLGDHRTTSVDSRNKSVGCINSELVVGRLLWRVWPFDEMGAIR